ncbi:MAG: hypothetical protein N2C14_24350, partial [Planctomycetales bacterium]
MNPSKTILLGFGLLIGCAGSACWMASAASAQPRLAQKKSNDASKTKEPKTKIVEKKWSNGNLMEQREVYLNAKNEKVIHGMFRFYHLNGNLREDLTFVHGKRHGHAKFFHPEGGLSGEVRFVEDKREGKESMVNPQGVKIA